MGKRTRVLNRRDFLYLSVAAAGSTILAACGGKAAPTQSAQAGSTTVTTPSGAPTNTPVATQAPTSTEVATQVSTQMPTQAAQPTKGAVSTASATRVAVPTTAATVAGPTASYKEAPMLAKLAGAGKLPPVEQRLPKNPMVLKPVEKAGKYGGSWNYLWGSSTTSWIRDIGYDYLVRWKTFTLNFGIEDIEPNVAESWDVKGEGKEYVFKLREGIKWSDGKPFSTDDIMFWFNDVVMNKDLTALVGTIRIPWRRSTTIL